MSEKNTRKRRVTMADVAAEAKVGQATVSFVMNGRDDMRVSASTSKRVIEVAKRLGYRPRSLGRPPKDVANEVIGLMFDEVATSPFAMITIEGAQEEAWAQDVLLEVVMTGGDKEYEAAILRKWSADRVMGVVYATIITCAVTPPVSLSKHRSILLNCYDENGIFPSAVPAERRGGEAATKALIEAGHHTIAFISGESWIEASAQRQEGYEKALRDAGRTINPDLIVESNFLPSGGRSSTMQLMAGKVKPDAIFCANDLMAVGCYEALKELGLKIGIDVAVIGYDDLEIARNLSPQLSSVLLPHREMGQMAVKSLLSQRDIPQEQTRVECPLVLRDSHIRP